MNVEHLRNEPDTKKTNIERPTSNLDGLVKSLKFDFYTL